MGTPRRRSPLAPGPATLRGYRVSWLRGDVLAGLTVAAYLVPQVMAYADLALAGVVAVLVFAGPMLARFPTAALAAIIVYAATRLIDLTGFRRLAAFRRSELLLALAAFAGVLVFDILYGVLLAVGLSVAEMLHRVARPHDAVQGFVPGLAGMHDIDDYPEASTVPGLVVYRYDSPLFFANAEDRTGSSRPCPRPSPPTTTGPAPTGRDPPRFGAAGDPRRRGGERPPAGAGVRLRAPAQAAYSCTPSSSAASPALASANSIAVFGSVYSSLSIPA